MARQEMEDTGPIAEPPSQESQDALMHGLFQDVSNQFQAEPPQDENAYKDAFQKAAWTVLETPIGLQLTDDIKQWLTSKDLAPYTYTVLAGAVAGIIISDAEVSMGFEIPWQGLTFKFEIDGPLVHPNALMITVSGTHSLLEGE